MNIIKNDVEDVVPVILSLEKRKTNSYFESENLLSIVGGLGVINDQVLFNQESRFEPVD